MKALFGILPVLAVVFLTGCGTIQSNVTPAIVQTGVYDLVSQGTSRDTNIAPYVRAAGDVICNAATGTNIAPGDITQALDQAGLGSAGTPDGVLVVDGALLLYEAAWNSYGTNAVNSVPQLQPYLQAVCNGINQGLSPAPPEGNAVNKNWAQIRLP